MCHCWQKEGSSEETTYYKTVQGLGGGMMLKEWEDIFSNSSSEQLGNGEAREEFTITNTACL